MGLISFILLLYQCVAFAEACKFKVCYYSNDAIERPRVYRVLPVLLNPHLCTHMVFAFAHIANNKLKASLPIDEGTPWDVGLYASINHLKIFNPTLLTLLSVGGWDFGVKEFITMSSSQQNRKTFIDHAITFLRNRTFDGLDLHWEFPTARGGDHRDKENFSHLVKELKAAFVKEGKNNIRNRLLLTAALTGDIVKYPDIYQVDVIAKELDFVSLMTYDLNINISEFQHPSILCCKNLLNTEKIMGHYLQKGLPKNKLVIGIQMYGRSFIAYDFRSNLIRSETANSYATNKKGILAYFEICQMIQYGWKVGRLTGSPYLRAGPLRAGYEDIESIRNKVALVKLHQLAGVMLWSVDMDDFNRKWCNKFPRNLVESVAEACQNADPLKSMPGDESPKVIIPYKKPFPDPTGRNRSAEWLTSSELYELCKNVKGNQLLPYPGVPCLYHVSCKDGIGTKTSCPSLLQRFDAVNRHCQWYFLLPQCMVQSDIDNS